MADKDTRGMIQVDGSCGEGGGQILRTSLALSMCTGNPFEIQGIRAKRPKPGLMRQHLACVLAAQTVCSATVHGAQLGSTSLRFEPGTVLAGEYAFAVGSAGSCMLVLQTVLPALLSSQAGGVSKLRLSGGTHNSMSPPFHFLSRAFFPLLHRLGGCISMTLIRHGFYPRGGGEVVVSIAPASGALRPFDLLEPGKLLRKHVECLIAGFPASTAEEELVLFRRRLGWGEGEAQRVDVPRSEGPGNVLMATLEFEHVTAVLTSFGEKARPADDVARDLADQVAAYVSSGAPVGEHLCDQLMVPMALAVRDTGKRATWRTPGMTQHSWTNIDTIKKFLPVAVEVASEEDGWHLTLRPES